MEDSLVLIDECGEEDEEEGWLELCETDLNHITNLVNIDDNTFIVIGLEGVKPNRDGNIHQYDVVELEWSIFSKYTPCNLWCGNPSIAWNDKTKKIWMIGRYRHLEIHEINSNDGKLNTIKPNSSSYFVGESASILLINDEYHVICGSHNRQHLIWNDECKNFEIIHTFKELSKYEGLVGHRTIHIKSKNNLLMFGGFKCNEENPTHYDTIYRYFINNKKWELLKDIKLPTKMSGFGCVISNDHRYIIIFGGRNNHWAELDEIYVLNVDKMDGFKLSNIRCPIKSQFEAILMTPNYTEDKLFISGYLRKECKEILSIYNEILLYYRSEFIHLIPQQQANNHWEIDVNEIILSTLPSI